MASVRGNIGEDRTFPSGMPTYELAQLNIALMKESLESPRMADFVANLDRINAVADQSAGFVWRYRTPQGTTEERELFGEKALVNVSVWQDLESLRQYVYQSAHRDIMRRRAEWFESMSEAFLVLWWVPAGHRPSLAEARARLDLLRTKGPTADAFTFRQVFAAPNPDSAGADS
jgi:hypothetical protein